MQRTQHFVETKCSDVRLSWSDHQTKTFSKLNTSFHVPSIQLSRFNTLKCSTDSQDEEEPEQFELPTLQTSGGSFQLSNGAH